MRCAHHVTGFPDAMSVCAIYFDSTCHRFFFSLFVDVIHSYSFGIGLTIVFAQLSAYFCATLSHLVRVLCFFLFLPISNFAFFPSECGLLLYRFA